MRWRGGRRSSNVEDRRRAGGGGRMAVGGGLGLILALVAVFVFGGDPTQLLQGGGGLDRELTAAEKEAGDFVATVLGYTEDVWDREYPRLAAAHPGAPAAYVHPKLVLFAGGASTGCGFASSAVGPFYCPGDRRVYIDLQFFEELSRRFGAPGDFAQAYVVAHEVAHHIQTLIGRTGMIDAQRGRVSETELNRLSVRLELQADYLAGVWAHHARARFDVLEPGDLEEALTAAAAIGDDRLQEQARGRVVPDSFTHGTSAQRVRWFRRGFETGDPLAYDPFKERYEDL